MGGVVSVRIFGHYVSLPLLLLMLAEAATHVGAVYLAGTVRFLDIHFQVQSLTGESLWLFPRALLYALVMLGTMTAFGLYGSELHKKDREYQVRFLASFPAVAVVLAFVYYAVPESTLARGIMALGLLFSFIFTASARALFFRIVGHDALKRRILVIGSGSRAAEVEALLTRLGPSAGFNLVGFVQSEWRFAGARTENKTGSNHSVCDRFLGMATAKWRLGDLFRFRSTPIAAGGINHGGTRCSAGSTARSRPPQAPTPTRTFPLPALPIGPAP